MNRIIYNRVKPVFDARGVSCGAIAKRLGISEETVRKWYLNTQQPSVKSLYKIANELKIGVCQLLV